MIFPSKQKTVDDIISTTKLAIPDKDQAKSNFGVLFFSNSQCGVGKNVMLTQKWSIDSLPKVMPMCQRAEKAWFRLGGTREGDRTSRMFLIQISQLSGVARIFGGIKSYLGP
ncbi:unnamed protein product [Leptosia nina]|uniref:Uncharacterized protein n=1 Tax=Leptosia nina TaxID=320188 RepID=A0AAV1J388_9NEOP